MKNVVRIKNNSHGTKSELSLQLLDVQRTPSAFIQATAGE